MAVRDLVIRVAGESGEGIQSTGILLAQATARGGFHVITYWTVPAEIKGGHALQPTNTAATVRVRDEKVLSTDGPFAETKEQLGGFYLIEARDRDEATRIAAKIPGARFGSIEVRPIMTFS